MEVVDPRPLKFETLSVGAPARASLAELGEVLFYSRALTPKNRGVDIAIEAVGVPSFNGLASSGLAGWASPAGTGTCWCASSLKRTSAPSAWLPPST